MTDISKPSLDREYFARFFRDQNIDEYAVISASSLHAPEGRRPGDLLPSAQAMILFVVEMDEDLFSGTQDEISFKVRVFLNKIRTVENGLLSALHAEGFEATAVRSITLQDGTIKGALSLPHCAAEAGLGEVGDNRLLISPRYGSRLGLGAVVTSREIEETPRPEATGNACNHCNKCISACPEQALSKGTLDIFKCRNVTGSVSGLMRPVVFRFISSGEHLPFSNRILNSLASRRVNTCADCLVSCPRFHKSTSHHVDHGWQQRHGEVSR